MSWWKRHAPLPLTQPQPRLDRDEEINIVALIKGQDHYVILFDDAHRSEAMRTLGRYASDPKLNFTWYDAATLSQQIRKLVKE